LLWGANIYAKINFVNSTLLAEFSIQQNMIEQINKFCVMVIGNIEQIEHLAEKR